MDSKRPETKTSKRLPALLFILLFAGTLVFSHITAFAETPAASENVSSDDREAAEIGTSGENAFPGSESGPSSGEAAAPDAKTAGIIKKLEWPVLEDDIRAAAAIVADADTGTVLWGRDIHSKFCPASITKLLTALVVLDRCGLDEEVYFSRSAVSNLEAGAVTIGAVEGDVLTVRDCLYALLLKSANEVANALAEHVSGSVGAFCELMNEKASELGCTDSDFRNPSGLTDPKHLTSAYDMALIASACMNSSAFMMLESENTRKLAPTARYPGGLTVTIGHKMKKSGESYYDERVTAGKTGYTSAAGNTLVTMAEADGRRLVAVVLKDSSPAHYTDTKKLLDFGFDNFENITPDAEKLLEKLCPGELLLKAGVISGSGNTQKLWTSVSITVPKGAALDDLSADISYDISETAPGDAVAYLTLTCLGRSGTSSYVINKHEDQESTLELEALKTAGERTPSAAEDGAGNDGKKGGMLLFAAVILAAAAAAGAAVSILKRNDEKRRTELFRQRRKERLESINMSEEEFEESVRKNREERRKREGALKEDTEK